MKDFGYLPDWGRAGVPRYPGFLRVVGPGIVWMALAQGSGELIWWPYIVAKYGLGFLFLLLPACLLQWPLTFEIGRYTLLTGETIWQGLIRLNRFFAFGLWILMTVQFLWFGAFASAGGTALASLTNFPPTLSERGQSLFWGYFSISLFFLSLLFARRVYLLIEKFMWFVAIFTFLGLFWSSTHPEVLKRLTEFVKGIFIPIWPENRIWDNKDATKLLTAVTFAGLGGFWTLFYSYWIREKGVGMAKHFGRITGLLGTPEKIPKAGFVPEISNCSFSEIKRWLRFLIVDSGVGIFGNFFTTLLMALLAYSLLFPKGDVPHGWHIAVVQSRFFEISWGEFGKVLFLLISAAFLSDTWLSTTDAVARVHLDIANAYFGIDRLKSPRFWYYFFVCVLTMLTAITMPLSEPGVLILISAVIGFFGTVSFTFAIAILNHKFVVKEFQKFGLRLNPNRKGFVLILFVGFCYLVLLFAYFFMLLFVE